MRFTVPITYDVKGRLNDKKRSAHYSFTEHVSVDIPEIDPADAPVSCIWSPSSSPDLETELWHHQANERWCDTDGNHMTRWYDGRHWKRLLLSDCAKNDWNDTHQPPLTPSMLADELASGHGQRAIGVPTVRVPFLKARPVANSPMDQFSIVSDESRSFVLFDIDQVAANIMLVDGHLYKACMEPYFVVSKTYLGGSQCRDIKVWTTQKPLGHEAIFYVEDVFPITQFNEALASATAGLDGNEKTQADRQIVKLLATKNPSFVFRKSMQFDYKTKWQATKLIDEVYLYGPRLPGPWTHELSSALKSIDDDIRIERLTGVVEEYGSYLTAKGIPVHLLEQALSILNDRQIEVVANPSSGNFTFG
jgi:hypothetical protein